MDAQLKRGILDACVLAVLEKGESYGYKMITDINEFIPITESTLYPILKRLEAAELVSVHSREYNGRLRKYYSITEAGQAHVSQLLVDWEELVKIYQYIKNEREQRND